jgi:membrane-bound serine protease (ClpP class)
MMASMKKGVLYIIACLFILQIASAQNVISIEIDGTINPVAADYVHRSIEKANKENADCLIIKLNTPGGLLKSTRVIVSDLLDSPVPVVVYVSPNGAHAGSAGVFITMAAHVAAMAPGTNIGAAHPVSMQQQMDPVMNEKATNDATAFIRTIAQYRKRDTVWAEKAVRYSLSITASEALSQNIIDLVANDMKHLLEQINGKEVMTPTGKKNINTHNAAIENMKMSWIEKLLNILVDPNIAYILMLLGIYGLLFELYSPGAVFPGVIGGICIILAFYSMHTLPVNYAALALILFAVILFILEIKIISHGILAIGGTVSLLLGSLMLIRNESPLEFARISRSVIFPVVALTALFFFFLVIMGLRAQRRKPVTGTEAFEGAIGVATENFDRFGTILIMGELWQAETVAGRIEKGQKLKVTRRENLKLFVEPIPV